VNTAKGKRHQSENQRRLVPLVRIKRVDPLLEYRAIPAIARKQNVKGLEEWPHEDTNWLRRVLEVNEIGSTGNRSWNLWMMGMSKQPLDFGAHMEMHFLTVRFL